MQTYQMYRVYVIYYIVVKTTNQTKCPVRDCVYVCVFLNSAVLFLLSSHFLKVTVKTGTLKVLFSLHLFLFFIGNSVLILNILIFRL